MNLDHELKQAFALTEMNNFDWVDSEQLKNLPPLTKRGSMTIPLNKETFEEMQAASVFTLHWRTQARQIMKKPRKFRVQIRMYQVNSEQYIEANAIMIKPDTVHKAWKAIDEASRFIMAQNHNADWDENRCVATIRV